MPTCVGVPIRDMGDETQPLEYDDSTDDETTNQRKRPVGGLLVLNVDF